MTNRLITLLFATLGMAASADHGEATGKPDHGAWNRILAKYVNAEHRVDYAAIKAGAAAELGAYIQQFAAPFPGSLTVSERKAALINAYNALTVSWIVQNYPVESIWRTRRPFTEARFTIDGRKVSLDKIESELRGMGDPRIHAALVCASISCPPLRREAYLPEQLDRQLDDNTRMWLNNPKLNRFEPVGRKVELSMIFDWYKADFGKNRAEIIRFLVRFIPPEQAKFLSHEDVKIVFIKYNWGLNDVTELGAKYSSFKFYADQLRNKI